MLSSSDHVIEDGEELSKAEKRELLKLSIQEVLYMHIMLFIIHSMRATYIYVCNEKGEFSPSHFDEIP